jgi:sugar lactone lactonase YvrE
MWVSAFSFGTGTSDTSALLQFPVSLLDASGTVAPSIVIGPSNHSLDWPTSLAFDPEGNLWITNWGREGRASTIVKYAASQLATSGNLAPAATILSDGNSLLSPAALAFDANGALWVANFGGSNTSTELVKYTPAQLSATGSPTPAVAIITRNQEGLDGILPTAMAFDAAGNLWMGGYFDTPIVMLSPAQLSASGKPLPAIFYKALQSPVRKTMGMAFDAGGNLWVAQPDVLYGLAKDKIYTGGSLDGTVMIEGIDLASPSAVYAFDPPPSDLPLCQPR